MLGLRLIARQVFQTTSREALLLLVVFLGFLWAHLVNHLRIEWTVNPQYGYGWAVPWLCLYLIWQRISKSEFRNQKSGPPNPRSQTPDAICHPPSSSFIFLCVLLALLYAPTRLIEDATPEWRLVSWALALDVVGLTLLLIYSFLERFNKNYSRTR
jgi:hypothetical protein